MIKFTQIKYVGVCMLKHEHWILPIELSKRDVLADLIDDEFIEIGSSATVYDKPEIIR
jgi:hypothetical protein